MEQASAQAHSALGQPVPNGRDRRDRPNLSPNSATNTMAPPTTSGCPTTATTPADLLLGSTDLTSSTRVAGQHLAMPPTAAMTAAAGNPECLAVVAWARAWVLLLLVLAGGCLSDCVIPLAVASAQTWVLLVLVVAADR